MDRQLAVAEALTDVQDALDRLGKVLGQAYTQIEEDRQLPSPKIEDKEAAAFLASVYAIVNELRVKLQTTESAVDSWAARAMRRAGFWVSKKAPPMFLSEGVRVKLEMTGSKQIWNREGCLQAVVNKVAGAYTGTVYNPETGEAMDAHQYAAEIARWVERVAPSGNLRTTPLEELEIKPNDYRDFEGGRHHCRVVGTIQEV